MNDITFEQISGSLASLLLLWAAIERQARKEVSAVHGGSLPRSAYGIAAVLNAWVTSVSTRESGGSLRASLASVLRDQLQEPLNLRNNLCHGLIGISSADSVHPATLKYKSNNVERSATWGELQATLGWLSKVPFAVSMISNSSSKVMGNRIIDSPENREWWLVEFGIKLFLPAETEKD